MDRRAPRSPFHQDARRFEIATSCTPLLAGLRCSLELLEQAGTDNQRLAKIQNLSHKLWTQLHSLHNVETILEGAPPAGLVSFNVNAAKSTPEIVASLGKKEFCIRSLEEPECLRACVHVMTNLEEIESLTEEIKKISLS